MRQKAGIVPHYKMIDSCAAEFDSYIPYFYATYEDENESVVSDRKRYWYWALVLSVSVRG